ncbi:MAG: hypothetical protein HFJ33_04985 [Clostridia bacterium]|nr:hypothetical protein [Clostridia bacterium]
MEIEIKNRREENVMQNIAFIKAFLIKKTIDNLEVSYPEKEEIKQNKSISEESYKKIKKTIIKIGKNKA